MHLFDVIAGEEPALSVFATSYDEAARLYTVHWLTHHEADLPDLEVKQRNASWPGIDIKLLAEALALEVSGIGHFDADSGWTILPPHHGWGNVR